MPCDQEDSENVQKTMMEVVVAVTFLSAIIFIIKSIGQSIAGWLGLTLFKKLVVRYQTWRRKTVPQVLEDKNHI